MKMDTGTAGTMAVMIGLIAFFLGKNNPQPPQQVQQFSQPTAIQANQQTANYTAKYKWSFEESQAIEYIQKYKDVAKQERQFGIFASITLAQGLLETNAGNSRLVKECNNHFGMKCFSRSCAKGHCKNFTDDSHKDFFKSYPGAWGSFREHSNLLNGARYKKVLAAATPEDAAVELKKAGYATDPNYHKKIIDLINLYNLKQYD